MTHAARARKAQTLGDAAAWQTEEEAAVLLRSEDKMARHNARKEWEYAQQQERRNLQSSDAISRVEEAELERHARLLKAQDERDIHSEAAKKRKADAREESRREQEERAPHTLPEALAGRGKPREKVPQVEWDNSRIESAGERKAAKEEAALLERKAKARTWEEKTAYIASAKEARGTGREAAVRRKWELRVNRMERRGSPEPRRLVKRERITAEPPTPALVQSANRDAAHYERLRRVQEDRRIDQEEKREENKRREEKRFAQIQRASEERSQKAEKGERNRLAAQMTATKGRGETLKGIQDKLREKSQRRQEKVEEAMRTYEMNQQLAEARLAERKLKRTAIFPPGSEGRAASSMPESRPPPRSASRVTVSPRSSPRAAGEDSRPPKSYWFSPARRSVARQSVHSRADTDASPNS